MIDPKHIFNLIWTQNPLSKFVRWIKPTFEGNDGKASGKRFTTVFFVGMSAWFVYANMFTTWLHFYAFVAVLITVLLMWGIITTQNLTEFFQLFKGRKTDITNKDQENV